MSLLCYFIYYEGKGAGNIRCATETKREKTEKKSYQCLSYTTKLVEVVDPFYKECLPEADIHPRNFSSSQ
jgi:hypothetical protein